MDKWFLLKKKPFKKTRRDNSVLDYLKSDTYMFAPLSLTHPPSDFLSPESLPSSSAPSVELRKPIKESVKFHEKVSDYLKSDTYMYASMVVPSQSVNPLSQEHKLSAKTTNVAVSTTKYFAKDKLPSLPENQRFKNPLPKAITLDQNAPRQSERVKRTVHQNCCSTSVSGEVRLRPRLRNLVD